MNGSMWRGNERPVGEFFLFVLLLLLLSDVTQESKSRSKTKKKDPARPFAVKKQNNRKIPNQPSSITHPFPILLR